MAASASMRSFFVSPALCVSSLDFYRMNDICAHDRTFTHVSAYIQDTHSY
jgi:hypothetical protein